MKRFILFFIILSLSFSVASAITEKELNAHGPTVIVPKSEIGGRATGDDCTDPILVDLSTLPYTDLAQTTCGRGNSYDATGLGSYDGGEDIIYELTVTTAGNYNITMTTATTWTGMGLFGECPPGATALYMDTGSSGNCTIEGAALIVGTYYLMMDTWPTPNCITTFDLTIDAAASCPDPTTLTETNITQTTVDLGWTETGSATLWDIELGLAEFTPSGTPTAAGVTNTYTYGSGSEGVLTALTDYEWYVRADCGSGDFSDWVGPNDFTTAGPPPANDDCADAIELIVGASPSFATYTTADATDSGELPAPSCASYQGSDVWFILTVPATGDVTIDTDVGVITDGGMSAYSGSCGSLTQIECDDDDSANGFMPLLELTELTPSDVIYIRFWEYGGDNNGTFDITAYNVLCPSPIALLETNIGQEQADLGWTEGGTETDWEYAYGPTPFAEPTGSGTATTSNSVSLSGLSASTTYDWYVRANCGSDYSDWASSSFTTSDPPPANDECSGAILVTPLEYGGSCTLPTVASNSGATDSSPTNGTPGCNDYQGGDVWYYFTAGGDNITAIVTVNNWSTAAGAVYDDCVTTTEIACGGIFGTGSYNISGLTPGNTYYLRLWDYGNNDLGTVEFCLENPPTCPDPTTQTVENITSSAADLGWTENGTATTWEYAIGEAPFAEPTGNGINTTHNPVDVTLSASTDYQWYVRADCGSEDYSEWIGPNSFTTLDACPFPTALVETNIGPEQADLGWTEMGIASSWDIELGLAGFTPTENPTAIGVTNSYTYGSLTASTTYDWYVRANCGSGYSTWQGPSSFTTLVSCPEPTDLLESNETATSADLSWTAGWTESLWNLEYGVSGFEQGTGTMVNGLDTPEYSLDDLTEGTWDWYVQADCEGRAVSTWAFSSFEAFDRLPNDECAGAIPIGEVTDLAWDNTVATTSGFNGNTHYINKDMWYIYTPSGTGLANFDLCGSTFDTKLTVYDDCVPTTELGYNDDNSAICGAYPLSTGSAILDIPVVSGETYLVQVGAFSSYYGAGDLTITFRAYSDETDILTYSFPEQTGPAIIDAGLHTVTIETGYGTDVTALVATFGLSTYATAYIEDGTRVEVPQVSGTTINDFTNPVVYIVEAEDGTRQTWTVNVTVSATQSSENDILTYSFPEQTGAAIIDDVNHTVDIEVEYLTDVTTLVSTFTLSPIATAYIEDGTRVEVLQESGTTANDFTSPVNYLVYAEDATMQEWTVSVTVAAPLTGDLISDPFIISTLPFNDTGDTSTGFTYNYGDYGDATGFTNLLCTDISYFSWANGTLGGGADVVYQITLTTPTQLIIDLCGSSYDTAVALVTGDGLDPEDVLLIDDDSYLDSAQGGCETFGMSYINCSVAVPADTYYIIVGSYGFNEGEYELNVSEAPVVTVPQNVLIVNDGTNVTITWDPVVDAFGYKVYSSADPYGVSPVFAEDTSGTFTDEQWVAASPAVNTFYYVTAYIGSSDNSGYAPVITREEIQKMQAHENLESSQNPYRIRK